MYNRYIGNTGRRYRVPEASDRAPGGGATSAGAAHRQERQRAPEPRGSAAFGVTNLAGSLRSLIPPLPFGMDTGDLLLLLLLFFLYTESGDEDFLIILAVVSINIIADRPERLQAD